jgi:transmembrane protein
LRLLGVLSTAMTSFVHSLLRSHALFYLGALVLTSMFWCSGLSKLWDFGAAQDEMAHFDIEPSALFAVATIVVQLGGSALIVFGRRWAWLGAGALSAFTLATIPLAHPFWTLSGPAVLLEKAFAQEHASVVGALLLAAILAELKFGKHDV